MSDESVTARGAGEPQHGESVRNARARTGLAVCGAFALTACGAGRADVEVPPLRASLSGAPRTITTPASVPPIEPIARVTGDIRFLAPPGDLDLGRVVVYLEPRSPASRTADRRPGDDPPLPIVSQGEEFAPPLVAVPWNRTVVLANEGPVNHRLFATDLGSDRAFELPPDTRSDPFHLPPAGPIRFFCSLHADETFVVFSERTAHVAVVRARERFAFGPVEPGRYVLSIWSERVQGPVREIVVDGYSRRLEPVWIDPRLVRPVDVAAGARR